MSGFHLAPEAWLTHLAVTYGVWAVLVSVMLESTGLPVPSESILIAVAALAAGQGQPASAVVPIVLAAAAGAVIGDNLGYGIGRGVGAAVLERYGPRIGLTPARFRLGRYLFQRYGGRIVVAARFVSVLRTCVSLLAGATRMPWPRFLAVNALGGCLWAGTIGFGAYALGERARNWSWPVSLGLAALVAAGLAALAVALRRRERALQAEADRALCGR